MTELPSGTVTFLFTDIERSTEHLAAMGNDAYADALDAHRQALRDAFKAHDGHEIATEGDSFFVAFARAHDALDAALAGQRSLGEHPLRARMGIHTGEALVRSGGYVGHDVHKAKRISDAGHGGQILVSQTIADLIAGDAVLVDLGPHRLKDLGEPQRIFQVGANEFPPLRSLDAFTHSLPLQRSTFIGREREIADVREMLRGNRMVTLTGVGGCGKTRLAQQIGAEELDMFHDGVFFVNLAPVSDPDVVAREIATSIGVPTGGGLAALGAGIGGPIEDLLFAYLRSRTCLLILDNCEHLIDACADICDRILARSPHVCVLATSREALRVEGEQSWTVPSLTLPSEGVEDSQSSESISLFKARAKAVRPSFDLSPDNIAAVVEICRRLDGIPLAVEFAAARVSHLSPRQIADRLDDRFRLLTGGQRRVQRQNTLQAALDWSYDLLDDSERILLRRLSVFAGDFSIDAAEGICSDEALEPSLVTDLLGSLVSKSLIEAELSGDDVRYRLLETVRAYAAQRLAHADEAERTRARHRDWYLEQQQTISWDEAFLSLDYTLWLWREEANIAAAVEWCIAERRPDLLARMASRASNAWAGSEPSQFERWINTALEAEDQLDPDDRVICLIRARGAMRGLGEVLEFTDRAVRASEHASPGVATMALAHRGFTRGVVAAMTRNEELTMGAYDDLDQALDRAADDVFWQIWVLFLRAMVDLSLARIEQGQVTLEDGFRRCLAAGQSDMAGGFALYVAIVNHVLGDNDGALAASEIASMAMDRMIGLDRLAAGEGLERFPRGFAAPGAAIGAATAGTAEQWTFLRAYRPHALRTGVPGFEADLVLACAILWYYEGDLDRAARLLSWVRAHTMSAGAAPTPGDYILYLHYRELARKALGPDDARRARAEGERLSLDDAVELAFA